MYDGPTKTVHGILVRDDGEAPASQTALKSGDVHIYVHDERTRGDARARHSDHRRDAEDPELLKLHGAVDEMECDDAAKRRLHDALDEPWHYDGESPMLERTHAEIEKMDCDDAAKRRLHDALDGRRRARTRDDEVGASRTRLESGVRTRTGRESTQEQFAALRAVNERNAAFWKDRSF